MAGNNMNINHLLISGLSERVNGKLDSDIRGQYQKITGKLSISKGNYTEALKAELLKEAAMTEAVQELLKEIANLMENAAIDFCILDQKWSKSHLS